MLEICRGENLLLRLVYALHTRGAITNAVALSVHPSLTKKRLSRRLKVSYIYNATKATWHVVELKLQFSAAKNLVDLKFQRSQRGTKHKRGKEMYKCTNIHEVKKCTIFDQ